MAVISFTPTTWVDDSSPYITAAQLNRLETAVDELAGGDSAAWSTWTPSYANITVGNGTVSARYSRVGDTITATYYFVLGSTSSIGSNATFSIPVTAATTSVGFSMGTCRFTDGGSPNYGGAPFLTSATTVLPQAHTTSGTYSVYTNLTASVPFTWASGDVLRAMFTYEAA